MGWKYTPFTAGMCSRANSTMAPSSPSFSPGMTQQTSTMASPAAAAFSTARSFVSSMGLPYLA